MADPRELEPEVVEVGDVETFDESAENLARGRELYVAGALAEAAAAFSEASRHDPSSADAAYALAKALLRNDPAKARAALERALTLRPSWFEPWRALALLCARRGDAEGLSRAVAGARRAAPADGRCVALERDLAAAAL